MLVKGATSERRWPKLPISIRFFSMVARHFYITLSLTGNWKLAAATTREAATCRYFETCVWSCPMSVKFSGHMVAGGLQLVLWASQHQSLRALFFVHVFKKIKSYSRGKCICTMLSWMGIALDIFLSQNSGPAKCLDDSVPRIRENLTCFKGITLFVFSFKRYLEIRTW